MKRLSLLVSASAAAAAGLGAGFAVVRRLLDHKVVELAGREAGTAPTGVAARVSSKDAATGALPVVPAVREAIPASALPGWRQSLPVTPVPRDTVSATAAQVPADSDEQPAGAAGLSSRTWMVNDGADWDGSPQELVVPPAGRRGSRMQEDGTANP